jgi:hypothetical protein
VRVSIRWLAGLAIAALFVVVAALPAGAQAYANGLSVSDATPTPGSQVTVRVAGVQPNRPAPVTIDDVLVAAPTADANGIAVKAVTIPATLSSGEHLLVVEQGTGSARHAAYSRSIDVETGHSSFSRADGSSTPVLVAALLIATGLGAWAVVRRRSRSGA